MSSLPTSTSSTSQRPLKKRALTPRTAQATHLEALFAKPDREIHIPGSTGPSSTLSAPPEIVSNVQGSSAGAGSGEFHVYKASRRREYERLRLMDEEVRREGEEKAAGERREELERKDREKTERNRAKREKARARKAKGKKGDDKEGVVKKKLAPSQVGKAAVEAEAEEEKKEGEKVVDGGGEVKNEEEIGLVIEDDD